MQNLSECLLQSCTDHLVNIAHTEYLGYGNLISGVTCDVSMYFAFLLRATCMDMLVLLLSIRSLPFSVKRDDFNFRITNFPFLSSNIPSSPVYGVFISQLIRYARACFCYECFILRAAWLFNKVSGQGYVKERLKSSLRKFYGRYGDLINQYEVPLSRMLHDILDDDHIQWHAPLIRHQCLTRYWSGPFPGIWLFT